MSTQVFNFLQEYSTQPEDVDKIIISSFVRVNGINLDNNKFLKLYIVDEKENKESSIIEKFIEILNSENIKLDFEGLIKLFEFVISPADRVINGAIYTPSYIREYIISQTISSNRDIETLKIADIACGCGGFLFDVSQKIRTVTGKKYSQIFEENIYGLDIQDYSITRTKLLLSLLAISENEDIEEFKFNLFTGDALTFKFSDYLTGFTGFNAILGNPPYVCSRHLSKETKELMSKWSVSRSGHPDLYIPFFQIALENLSDHGKLGYITMNSFFKSLNGRALREYFQEKECQFRIVDFGSEQIFNSRNTYTCICLIKKHQSNYLEYTKLNNSQLLKNELSFNRINYDQLDFMKGWNLQDHNIASKLESIGIPLGNLYKSRHGIATLRNRIYIFKPMNEDQDYYYLRDKESNILYPIEKNICKDVINSNRLSREKEISEIRQKLIFPYKNFTDTSRAQILDESFFKEKFPKAYIYLDSKRQELALRDKGYGVYESWFAFGRTQSLEKMKLKLFFPKMSDRPPSCIINSDENLLFYNGQAIIGESEDELLLLKRIIESKLFWYYIKSTSKPYSSDYYSLNGNYINNFGIYQFNEKEKKHFLSITTAEEIDAFLFDKYQISIPT